MRHADTETQRGRETERQRDTEVDRQTRTDTHTHAHTHTHTHTEREREVNLVPQQRHVMAASCIPHTHAVQREKPAPRNKCSIYKW